jgi:hypothetical protein
LLIIPGYIIGLNCLLLVTYRTFIAFFSESKSVLININKFGEQYFDLFALLIIWIISIIGLILLILMVKDERDLIKGGYKSENVKILNQNNSPSEVDNKVNVKIDKSEIKG